MTDNTTFIDWLTPYLKTPEERREYAQERLVLVVTEAVASAIADATERAGITREVLDSRLGKPRGYVTRMLRGSRKLTLEAIADILFACDVAAIELETSRLGVVETAATAAEPDAAGA